MILTPNTLSKREPWVSDVFSRRISSVLQRLLERPLCLLFPTWKVKKFSKPLLLDSATMLVKKEYLTMNLSLSKDQKYDHPHQSLSVVQTISCVTKLKDLLTMLSVLSSEYLNPSLLFVEVAQSKLLYPFSWKITQTA